METSLRQRAAATKEREEGKKGKRREEKTGKKQWRLALSVEIEGGDQPSEALNRRRITLFLANRRGTHLA